MNILDQIVEKRKIDVELLKTETSIKELMSKPLFSKPKISLKESILNPVKTGIIAEFKRNSPSKGALNLDASVEMVTKGYVNSGASALSILTEPNFFKGSNEDFIQGRRLNKCPILRKDFVFDEWQVFETKSYGADVILLIASILQPQETKVLAKLSKEIGLEVLLEIHDKTELDLHLNEFIDVVGVNNRNLKTFETNIETSLQLASMIPDEFLKISESGLYSIEQLEILYLSGYRGFLIGESFMKSSNPEMAAFDFMNGWMEIKTNLLSGIA